MAPWSLAEDKIAQRYLMASFLGHARAVLKSSTVNVLSKDGLPLVVMSRLWFDGRNVNKILKKLLNDTVVQLSGKPLIDVLLIKTSR